MSHNKSGMTRPSLSELLDDPTVVLLMQSDGVTRQDVEDLIERIQT